MPTVHEEAGGGEPPHIHVEGHGGAAKFWLPDTGIVTARGYNRRQLRRLTKIVEAHADEFLDRWHEFFG